MLYEVKDTHKIAVLFDGWKETLISTCLQNHMGKAYVTDETLFDSAVIIVDVFCFFAGKANEELVKEIITLSGKDFLIFTPQNATWARMIEKQCSPFAHKRQRYAIKKEPDIFNEYMLHQYVAALPSHYQLKMIDANLYNQVMQEDWSRDLCSVFETKEEYLTHGLGVVALKENEIVAGASSYTYYDDGIEIEIDTRKDQRRKRLALACGAKLILECLHRGYYPSWDAQNLASVALAEKLGYHFDKAYDVYEIYGF